MSGENRAQGRRRELHSCPEAVQHKTDHKYERTAEGRSAASQILGCSHRYHPQPDHQNHPPRHCTQKDRQGKRIAFDKGESPPRNAEPQESRRRPKSARRALNANLNVSVGLAVEIEASARRALHTTCHAGVTAFVKLFGQQPPAPPRDSPVAIPLFAPLPPPSQRGKKLMGDGGGRATRGGENLWEVGRAEQSKSEQ